MDISGVLIVAGIAVVLFYILLNRIADEGLEDEIRGLETENRHLRESNNRLARGLSEAKAELGKLNNSIADGRRAVEEADIVADRIAENGAGISGNNRKAGEIIGEIEKILSEAEEK